MNFKVIILCCVVQLVLGEYTSYRNRQAIKLTDRVNVKKPLVLVKNSGWLKGSIAYSKWTNQTFCSFLGIPYAESPSGQQRFKPPIPKKPWSGIRNASQMGQQCVQGSGTPRPPNLPKDVEDCLNLNIFTPTIPAQNQTISADYPVLFHVHGGSFSTGGNADYPASYLLERKIVLVVPNYRLDALGFLSTKTTEIPGNAGMLDILLALKWVKRNIKYFGGNANKITVMGQSGGGGMVSSLLVSPLAAPSLFQQMIIHSGTMFAPWSYAMDPVANARDIALRSNVPKNATIDEINEAFMKMDAYDLVKATNEHYDGGILAGINAVGGRSLTVGGPSNYLPHTPKDLIKMGFYKKGVRLLAGVVKNEGSFLTLKLFSLLETLLKPWKLLENTWFLKAFFKPLAVSVLGVQDRWTEVYEFANKIFHSQDIQPKVKLVNYAEGFTILGGTVLMKAPLFVLADANLYFSRENSTFLYTFDYKGEFSKIPNGGVAHSDELIYLFPHPPKAAHLNANDTKIAKKMIELWTSFVEHGVPQQKTDPNFVWPPMMNQLGPYLHINQMLKIDDDFTDEFTK